MKQALILISLFFSSQASFSFEFQKSAQFLPTNDQNIPVSKFNNGGITREQYDHVIDRVLELYSPVVKSLGGELLFNRNWDDGTVNAYASRDMTTGKQWYITMYGGLARHPLMTEDAFALAVCHELGHHLGGYPKRRMAFQVDPLWGSNEGEADYFSTLKCLRRYFTGLDNAGALSKLKIPDLVATSCQKSFANADEVLICEHSAMTGLTVGQFFSALSKDKSPVDFSTPDKKKVIFKIYNDHPKAQCRLDTYFQASLCDKNMSENLSNKDGNISTCTYHNGDTVGMRPRCWMTKL